MGERGNQEHVHRAGRDHRIEKMRSASAAFSILTCRRMRENVPIQPPLYSFVDHDRLPETVSVKPSKVIIVDGILIFENKELL